MRKIRCISLCLTVALVFAAAAEAENIAPLGKASASSSYGGNSAAKINDGNHAYPAGAWVSSEKQKEPQWVRILWDREYAVSSVRVIFGEEGNPWPVSALKIQILKRDGNPENDADWITDASVEGNRRRTIIHDISSGYVVTRGLRLLVTAATQQSADGMALADYHMVRVCEIEIEGSTEAKDWKPRTKEEMEKNTVSDYFQVSDPLFSELLNAEKGPDHTLLFMSSPDYNNKELCQRSAKKFAFRYVWEEQWEELRGKSLICPGVCGTPFYGAPSEENIKHGLPVFSLILHPTLSPAVKCFNDGRAAWVMDPVYEEAYLKRALELASRDKDVWGLWAGDEMWESVAIKIPPDKKHPYAETADKEIKEKFGFGKYGLPDSDKDSDPFKRIAHRRWVSAKMAALYKKTYEAVKKINPGMKLIGPDFSGAVPAADIEEMSKYFDIITNQSWNCFSPLTNQVATGCDTKCTADLSECPVWGYVQNTMSKTEFPCLEDIRERYSQFYRNGGTGLAILAYEWYDPELKHPKFNYPEKWRALLEIAAVTQKMPKLKFPAPDSALLYPSYSLLTLTWGQMTNDGHRELYSAYTVLGPMLRSWFSFVSDRQTERGVRKLESYKTLLIAWAKYETRELLDKLESYVKNGGVVICADPEAFSWGIDGEPLSAKWAELTGVKMGPPRAGAAAAKVVDSNILTLKNGETLSFGSPGRKMDIASPDARPLALFENGDPAVSVRRYGKGKIIQTASNILEKSPAPDSAAVRLLKGVLEDSGVKLNQDIWRFKLPPFKTAGAKDDEKSLCLTNNNVVFSMGKAKYPHNLDSGGAYSYDSPPRDPSDSAVTPGEWIPFSKGHLTNRVSAVEEWKKSPSKPEPQKWIAGWGGENPVTIVFDFKKVYSLDRVRLFYSGTLPPLKISAGMDNKNWTKAVSLPGGADAVDGVADLIVKLTTDARFFKLEFGARRKGEKMELAEIEVWGVPEEPGPVNIAPLARASADSFVKDFKSENYYDGGTPALSLAEPVSCGPERLNDGDYEYPSGSWVSAPGKGAAATLLWDKAYEISCVKIFFLGGHGLYPWPFSPWSFEISVLSENGNPELPADWRPVKTVTGNTDSPYVLNLTAPVVTKGVRISVSEPTYQASLGVGKQFESLHRTRIRELEVLGRARP